MVERREPLELLLVAGAAGDADGALRNRGEHHVRVKHLGRVLGHVHAVETRDGEEGTVDDVLLELADAGLDVAAEVHALEVGELGEELRLAAEGRSADEGAVGKFREVTVLDGDESVADILAREHAGEDGALGKVGGHVLHGVNTDVDAAVEERLVELAGEETLAADVGEGLVENLVTGGLKRDGRVERG